MFLKLSSTGVLEGEGGLPVHSVEFPQVLTSYYSCCQEDTIYGYQITLIKASLGWPAQRRLCTLMNIIR